MDANDPLRGIVHRSADGTLSHLPLEEVAINVFIVDGKCIVMSVLIPQRGTFAYQHLITKQSPLV
jgi:hypothetical protein